MDWDMLQSIPDRPVRNRSPSGLRHDGRRDSITSQPQSISEKGTISMRIQRFSAYVLASATLLMTPILSAQGFQPGGPLVVRDNQGTIVGQYFSNHQVSIIINGKPYIAQVNQTGLDGQVFFDQPNCHGNAFIDIGPNTIESRAAPGPGGVLLTADASNGVQPLSSASWFSASGGCFNVAIPSNEGVPAIASTVNVNSTFQPPFSLNIGQVSTPLAVPLAVPLDGVAFLATLALVLATAGAAGIRRLL